MRGSDLKLSGLFVLQIVDGLANVIQSPNDRIYFSKKNICNRGRLQPALTALKEFEFRLTFQLGQQI